MARILNVYKSMYSQVFDSEDNYIFNSDVVDEYLNLLMKYTKFHEAIEARQMYIKYLKKTNAIDH